MHVRARRLMNCMRVPLQVPGVSKVDGDDDFLVHAAGKDGEGAADGQRQLHLAAAQTSPTAGMRGPQRRYDGSFDTRCDAVHALWSAPAHSRTSVCIPGTRLRAAWRSPDCSLEPVLSPDACAPPAT